MMTLDHVGDQEAMVYAQLGQQPLARTTETSLEPRLGTLSCLSARPPDLAFWTGTRPQVVGVSPTIVPFLHSKRTAAARSPGSTIDRFVAVSSEPLVDLPSHMSSLHVSDSARPASFWDFLKLYTVPRRARASHSCTLVGVGV